MNAAISGRIREWMQRWLGRVWQPRRPRELRLCESLSLGERRFVAVIQFRDHRFLLGGTNSNIALLAQLPMENPGEEPQ